MEYDSAEQVRVTLLNGVEAHRGARPVLLGPPQRRAVLCVLVFRRRQWVSAESLLDALYDHDVPASGVSVVQTHVSALRRALEPDRPVGTPSTVLLSGHGGYQLRIADDQTDLGEFDRLVTDAGCAREHADWPVAQRSYDQALALCAGEPLAGIPGPFAEAQRAALVERRLGVMEDCLDLAVTLGRSDQVIDKLRMMITEHPLRERPHTTLMRALCLRGRQSEALEVYARLRRVLVDELGVEPGAESRALHCRILDGGHLTETIPVESPARPTLFERDSELATITELAKGTGGVAVVTGYPGHGKSVFLAEVARRVPAARQIDLTADGNGVPRLVTAIDELGLPVENRATRDDGDELCRVLAAAAPLVLVADNVSRTDEQSLRLLVDLASRLRQQRVLIVLSLDELPCSAAGIEWNTALETVATVVLRLPTFSRAAIGALVGPGLVEQIHQATAGIPRLVVALVDDLARLNERNQVPPYLPNGDYARALRHQVSRYSELGGRIMRSVAVLADYRPTIEVLAAVCEDAVSRIRDLVRIMVAAGLLAAEDPPAFRHPVLTNTLRWLCSPGEVERMRVTAARHTQLTGGSARQTARYLHDFTGHKWSAWTAVLVEAANESLREHALTEAVSHLTAALRIASPRERDDVLVLLGLVDMWSNPATARAHLGEALRAQRARKVTPTALAPLAWAMATARQTDTALALFDDVVTETAVYDPVAAKTLRASEWMIAALNNRIWGSYVARLRDAKEVHGKPDEPTTAAILVWDDAFAVRCSAQEALGRFPSQWSTDRLWEGGVPQELVGILAHLALWADDLTLARQYLEQPDDRYFGSVSAYRLVLWTQVLLQEGKPEQVLRDCGLITAHRQDADVRRPVAVVAQYVNALIELGRLDEAEQWLTSVLTYANPQSWEWTVVKYKQGLLCSARGQARQAAAHFLDVGHRNAAWGLSNPAYIPWRGLAAVELVKVGERARAHELATAELVLAQRWDTPRALGRAWCAVAWASEEDHVRPLLERAVEYLRRSDTVVDLIPALIDLARAHRKAGDTAQARALLTEARELAEPRSAVLLLAEVDAELG
nr:BTAD domain-containing putative transcriptional regulator [Kibdelosporangium sp. MJ126-NF4]CEL21754.1 transcriptional regulator, SARP family [Kibdelosporangium sp. MJ126-NF4]CTQ92534.1 transcriptional regulator, SARP family [Kibdelosporangium sp. MJ126-NF4]